MKAAGTMMRWERLDALRGAAMVWMTAYHLSFDLNYFHFWSHNFYTDPVWTTQRTLIVSLFLLCAGAGQALAVLNGQDWSQFWRRWWQIAGCAALVTLASWLMFPQSFIYFGVLHGMVVMLLLLRWLAPWAQRHLGWVGVLGAALVLAPLLVQPLGAGTAWAELLNQRALNWLGLITRKPVTEDYVPLLPWMGVMLWGFAATAWCAQQRSQWLAAGTGVLWPVAWLGRWSLSYYMLHQPLLIGLLVALRWLLG